MDSQPPSDDLNGPEDSALHEARDMVSGVRFYGLGWVEADLVRDEIVERIASKLRELERWFK